MSNSALLPTVDALHAKNEHKYDLGRRNGARENSAVNLVPRCSQGEGHMRSPSGRCPALCSERLAGRIPTMVSDDEGY
eukprot:385460-Amorphochlora_amoeboformis.AAC.1